MANYALRVPESLFSYARQVAEEEHVSMNQFFVAAIAEKVSALKTETYFRERQARGDLVAFDEWLTASPKANPVPGDELP
ncbi:MAG: toxin-antitoxin system HicB family antitoxin [Sulfuritalea sp.]|nr:toxin-antitoxin system HicB family antitoxin [Sulfuritalea sp.]MDP1981859.1 toxin-antitoxin system HicB family antitoxin [Sulfuritalea sp.]